MRMHIVIVVVLLYLFLVFFLSRFFVPNIGFRREPLPKHVPEGMQRAITKLKQNHRTPLGFAKAAHAFLASKFSGTHALSFLRFDLLFSRDLEKLWSQRVLPCNQITLMYCIFLVKSGLFSEEEIKVRHMVIYAMLHQYVQINHNGKWVDVDVWAAHAGIPFGKRSNFFTIALIGKYLHRQKLYIPP